MAQNIRDMLGDKEYKGMLKGIVDTSVPTKRGHGTNKSKVFGMRERNSEANEIGEVRITVVSEVKARTLNPIIFKNVALSTRLMTDEHRVYTSKVLNRTYERSFIKHGKRQYVDGIIHTNSLEGMWAHLRKLIGGIHHRPSPKHLQKYVDEFEFRMNHCNKSLELIFRTALKQSNIRRKHSEITK